MEEDDLAFVDEDEPAATEPVVPGEPWDILIVDDDEDVHQATEFALRGSIVLERPLRFLHAYSSAEALAILRQHPEVAVILLDVVMETEDAGLQVVGRIREELGLSHVRIILRTGQPGYAPEIEAITRYDINDYKTKSELTRNKLYTTVTAAIRSFDQIRRLDASRRGLELIIDSANRFMGEQGFQAFAAGVITQISALLGIQPEGLICAKSGQGNDPEESGQFVVLAAAGRYQHMVSCRLDQLADATVRTSLEHALREHSNLFGSHSLTLFFPGKAGENFAAYVDSTHQLREIDRHLLEVFCANIAICGENIGLVSRLRDTAYVDSLTLLPNRSALIEAVDAWPGEMDGKECTLALVDVDQFSETIDMLGYRYGDHLLMAIAQRLREALPTDVFVARVGGDVFAIHGTEDVVNAAVLREILFDPFVIEGGTQNTSFSLGFVRVAEDTRGGADLLRNAAIALKRAKADGPGHDAYYTSAVAVETRDRVRLLQDLRAAFDSKALFAVYQPQVDLATGQVVGLEALMRWRTPDNEFIPPDRFIPVAEQSGIIVGLGTWILHTALNTLKVLAEAGYRFRMAVNVSVVQFRHPEFLDRIDAALAEAGPVASQLELEITESVAMFGQADVEEKLNALRARGVAVVIDDFGTGFSSLSYLDRLPASCLKIDRTFINALDSGKPGERIAEMVIELGRRLDMRVLAEGVETLAQADRLRALGCQEAQGWLYGRPMAMEELLTWLKARPA